MKVIILALLFSTAFAKKNTSFYDKALNNYNRGNYYTGLAQLAHKFEDSAAKGKERELLENLIEVAGPHYFNTFSDKMLRKINLETTNLIMAKRNLYLGKYKYATKRINKISKQSSLYPEALLIKGTIEYKKGNLKRAIDIFNTCYKKSSINETIKENCKINIGRSFFKLGNFKKAIDAYNAIDKRSHRWPNTLIEKAWSYYYIGNYNRVLGILTTYDSPLLESYFFPETQILKALSFYRLCHYDESQLIVNNFYKDYKPKSDTLKKILSNKSSSYFFNLLFQVREDISKENKFLKNLVTQIEKRSKFKYDLNSFYLLNKEIYKSSRHSDIPKVEKMRADLIRQMNHYIRLSMYNFINSIHEVSQSMFDLQLEILSKKRGLIYKNKEIAKKDSNGSFENISIEKSDVFWEFKRQFWADELGDYTFSLKSNCEEKK